MRVVRRTTVLIALLVHHVAVDDFHAQWGVSPSGISAWQKAFLFRGRDSLVYGLGGGRPSKLTPEAEKTLGRVARCRSARRGL